MALNDSSVSSPERTRMQSGKAHLQQVGGYTGKDQKQIQTSRWWINHPGSVRMKFYIRDWLTQSIILLLVNNNKGEG